MAKILVVDDVRDMRDLLWAILEGAGFTCLQASSGAEMIDTLEKNTDIDLILLDINMPDMSGINAVEKLKIVFPDRQVKICFVSGSRDKVTVLKALNAGGQDYVVKPIDPLILMEKVSKLLGNNSSETNLATLKLRAKSTLHGVPIPFDFWITELSEVHLILESSLPFEKGGLIEVVSNSINHAVGKDLVFSCRARSVEKKDETYFVNCSFVGVHESIRKHIRSLVVRNMRINDEVAKAA